MRKSKLIAIATIIASFVVFTATYFAVAENKNTNNIFLDSDQDSLTDQEEKTIGTDPKKFDTDGDGYSDGAEISSGYNPLKPAPGDQLLPTASSASKEKASNAAPTGNSTAADSFSFPSASEITGENSTADSLALELDESNLTDGMVQEFMKLTLDKNDESDTFLDSPSYSEEDFNQVVQNALSQADVQKDLPEISDSDIKILPPIDDKDLTPEEIKEKQKQEIEKYLSSLAFIFASNAPFPVDEPTNLVPSLQAESDNLFSSILGGDTEKINFYAGKGEKGIEQIKKLETPYVMKDIHKSALQLALYILSFKDSVAASASDPMKGLAAFGSLQAVGESALGLQSDLSKILNDYGIEFVEMK